MPFTKENAKSFSIKANAFRWAKPRVPKIDYGIMREISSDNYSDARLIRVRQQLDAIDNEIAEEFARRLPDSKRIKELSDAQTKLAEQERQLSGRPLPGTLRPSSKQPKRVIDIASEPAIELAAPIESPSPPVDCQSVTPSNPDTPQPPTQ